MEFKLDSMGANHALIFVKNKIIFKKKFINYRIIYFFDKSEQTTTLNRCKVENNNNKYFLSIAKQ